MRWKNVISKVWRRGFEYWTGPVFKLPMLSGFKMALELLKIMIWSDYQTPDYPEVRKKEIKLSCVVNENENGNGNVT